MVELNKQQDWQYLHFVSRFTASMVDAVIQILVLVPVVMVFFPDLLHQKEPSQSFQWAAALVQTVVVVGFWLSSQSTPGKMIFHAKIVDADTGAKPTTKQFVMRYAGYIVSSMALFLGFIWAAFDKRNQGWHDKLANTVVIQIKKN